MRSRTLPIVCIVGRPNVGKSMLFNRIIGSRKAVVHETSHTTRDRIEAVYEQDEKSFLLVDTGGFMKSAPDRIAYFVKRQIEGAISEAEILLFVCDVKSGVTPQDEEIVPLLRKTNKKVFLVVNKVDNKELEGSIYDFYRLGLGDPYPVSAAHNLGVEKLLSDILKSVGPVKGREEKAVYKIAIAGRPNVGKSLFLNNILKEERAIVDESPGTTRDSIDTVFRKDETVYLLIDTAGIRHKRKVKEAVDVYSIMRSKEAIERSDVVFLLIDGYEGLRNDDVKIFNFITDSGKCCVIVVNKWDLVKGIPMADYKNAIIRRTPPMDYYPIVFASAKTGRNVLSSIDMVKYVMENAKKKIATGELNKFLNKMKSASFHGMKRPPRIYYMVQRSAAPPVFLAFVDDLRLATTNCTNFIEGALRKEFFFMGTPIKIEYRPSQSSGHKWRRQ